MSHINSEGKLEVEYAGDGVAPRVRVRCKAGHYVHTDGAAAACGVRPASMTAEVATRAIVLHRRVCEGAKP